MADEQLIQQDMMKKQKQIKPAVVKAPAPIVQKEKKAEIAEKEEEKQIAEDKAKESGEKVSGEGKGAASGKGSEKSGAKKDAKEKPKKKKKVVVENKHVASVHGKSLPISLKYSKAIGKFIKNRKIEEAINNLKMVEQKKMAVPMKGELAHRKGKKLNGKGMMSGKFPVKASGYFIKLLKSLDANSAMNGLEMENTRIREVIVNKAPDQMHRFGGTKYKRTHVMIKCGDRKK